MSVFIVEDVNAIPTPFNKDDICEEFENWIAQYREWKVLKNIPEYDYIILRKIVRKCVYRVNKNFNEHDITKEECFNQILGIIFAAPHEMVEHPVRDFFKVVITDNVYSLEKHLENFKTFDEETPDGTIR